jgi:hypothetical protein
MMKQVQDIDKELVAERIAAAERAAAARAGR